MRKTLKCSRYEWGQLQLIFLFGETIIVGKMQKLMVLNTQSNFAMILKEYLLVHKLERVQVNGVPESLIYK